jgi:hypothetical protein
MGKTYRRDSDAFERARKSKNKFKVNDVSKKSKSKKTTQFDGESEEKNV